MTPEAIAGVVLIVMGCVTIGIRRRLGADAVRRIRFWVGRVEDTDDFAFQYGMLGGVFVIAGIVVLIVDALT